MHCWLWNCPLGRSVAVHAQAQTRWYPVVVILTRRVAARSSGVVCSRMLVGTAPRPVLKNARFLGCGRCCSKLHDRDSYSGNAVVVHTFTKQRGGLCCLQVVDQPNMYILLQQPPWAGPMHLPQMGTAVGGAAPFHCNILFVRRSGML
jgi:hypothetical protein